MKPIIGFINVYTSLEKDVLNKKIQHAKNLSDVLEYHGIETVLPTTSASDWVRKIDAYNKTPDDVSSSVENLGFSDNPQKSHNELLKRATHVVFLRGHNYSPYFQSELSFVRRQEKPLLTESDIEGIIKTHSDLHASDYLSAKLEPFDFKYKK